MLFHREKGLRPRNLLRAGGCVVRKESSITEFRKCERESSLTNPLFFFSEGLPHAGQLVHH